MADCTVCGFSIETADLCTVTSPACPYRPLNTQYGRDNPCEDVRCNLCYPDPDPEWANEEEIREHDQPVQYEDLETHIDQHVKFTRWATAEEVDRLNLLKPTRTNELIVAGRVFEGGTPPNITMKISPDVTALTKEKVDKAFKQIRDASSRPRVWEAPGYPSFKDSGSRQLFTTGAQRDVSEGKGYFHLLPFEGLEAVAQVFETGAIKYGRRNWEMGIPVENFLNSASRHLSKAANGWDDEPHLAMAGWNILCAIATIARIKSGRLPQSLEYTTQPDPF